MAKKSRVSAEYTLEVSKDIISQQIQDLQDKSNLGALEEDHVRRLEILTKTLIAIMNSEPKKKKRQSVSGKDVSNDKLLEYAKTN